jgi:uncharacterized protein YndB with AHSA1/START domain
MTELINEAIECATLIRATPEQVYDALTTGPGLDSWFTSGSRVDPRPGGEIHFQWRNWGPDRINAEDNGQVLEARRPERFVFQWQPDNPSYTTTVEIAFEPVADGVVVRLKEHGYHDTPAGLRHMLGCASGWGEALTLVKFYTEHGLKY